MTRTVSATTEEQKETANPGFPGPGPPPGPGTREPPGRGPGASKFLSVLQALQVCGPVVRWSLMRLEGVGVPTESNFH
eukprot:98276-Hanusia_phi.AAC.1